MTSTDVRQTLIDVAEAVEVPTPDRLAFQARVRVERRRRVRSRAGAGLVAAAAVAAVVGGAPALLASTGTRPGPGPAATVADPVVATPSSVVGFVVDEELVLGTPTGYRQTGVPARNVLGMSGNQLVLADGTGALVGVPVSGDGQTGTARRLIPEAVDRAWLEASTGSVVAQVASGAVLIRERSDGAWSPLLDPVGDLNVTDGVHRVESDPDGMTLFHDRGTRILPAQGGILGVELSGGVLALSSFKEVRFFDSATGRRLSRVPGEGTGELSPDAATWVGSLDGVPVVLDPRTGARRNLDALPAGAGDVGWLDDDSVVSVVREGDVASLWECTVSEGSCRELYRDDTGTLQLHS